MRYESSIPTFEDIFPTNWGYVSIEKWSQIFVSGTRSARTESEEKVILVSENDLFLQNKMAESNWAKVVSINLDRCDLDVKKSYFGR